MAKLSTNRTFLSFMMPGLIAEDLNTIVNQADGMVSKKKDVNSFFRMYRFAQRINGELERRKINYRISNCFCKKSSVFLFILIIPNFIVMSQVATAMNLLSEDYNNRG